MMIVMVMIISFSSLHLPWANHEHWSIPLVNSNFMVKASKSFMTRYTNWSTGASVWDNLKRKQGPRKNRKLHCGFEPV